MNPSELARHLGVNGDTVRRWANTYTPYLSPSANPAKGKPRSFTPHDARVLLLVSTLRDAGIDHEDIVNRLEELRAQEWQSLPALPDGWLDDPADMVRSDVAASRASELAQLAVLQTELENARQTVAELETRLETLQAEHREELAAERVAREEAVDAQTHLAVTLQETQIDLERARGEVAALNARIEAYSMAYSVRGEKPTSAVTLVGLTAIITVILVILIAAAVVLITSP